MGKPTGFMEYRRESEPARLAPERVGDWQEFHARPAEDVLGRQGAR